MTSLLLNVEHLSSNVVPTLNQDFTTWKTPQFRSGGTPINSPFKLLSDPTFSWKSGYIWEHPAVGKTLPWPAGDLKPYPAFTSDTDADCVPNADMIAQLGISPYSCTADGLMITPVVTPATIKAMVDPGDYPATYLSGALTSFPYAQLYGVFAMVAKIPKGKGLWPAFWMLPFTTGWPPELDIMEVLGQDTTALWTTVHSNTIPSTGEYYKNTKGIDLSLDFHEYAVDWGPQTISWYLDRNLVFSSPTPRDMHKACYLLANLAIGKPNTWAQAPATGPDGLPILGSMTIRSIKAWQRLTYV